ncbi:MAG TPA: cupin domain-containing protein, partial [Thermoleophilaceae bacterium]|nr:cupin domain-containing protein [Thermoleophilaceae bacterium]
MAAGEVTLEDAWVEGDAAARWRSAAGHGPGTGAQASGSSIIEVDEGCRLPRHTDSAEETVVVLAGCAAVMVGAERAEVHAGGAVLVPRGVPHEVHNVGEGRLRFFAVYAG